MAKRQKQLLIPEEKYNTDFQPVTGFYEYHVKNKTISVSLSEIQGFGVNLQVAKQGELDELDINTLPINTIRFSSSKKKKNVKNLMWYIRCLACHPENIDCKQKIYQFHCSRKDKKTDKISFTMKGNVSCNVWPQFIETLTNKIIENEKT